MTALWAALPWLAPFLALPTLARREFDLSRSPPVRGRPVSIIIPARNESATIETVVRSVLASTYAPFEVVVVDDRSEDDTARAVERLAAEDPRLRLVRGGELPTGWFGKAWACWQGYRAAAGDLLVFTDADTRHAPALLEHAVGALAAGGADLVTAVSRQRCETFWERVVMPQIWLILGLRYSPARVNRAVRPRDVIANGQFILVTREAYEAIGTHEAVRDEVAEDLALAQACVRHGRKLWFASAESLIETRMYRSLRHLVEGWSKNVYLGGRRSFPDEPALRALVPLLLALPVVFWLLPVAGLGWAAAGGSPAGLATASAIAAALSAMFWGLISYGMGIPAAYGLAYPLGTLVLLYIFARSVWRGGRAVEWKGRVYRVSSEQ
ncbi:MAG TPA: glycosyltransferase family 2 protein [Gemmatimonadales bacterium]|nr:glycosyltransferase family 2 protein [Gemmatimonadales bacterium]